MPIAGGVVIPVQVEASQDLAERLGAQAGVEVSGVGPAGIALVFESDTMEAMNRLTSMVRERKDVADLQMTYCNWEDVS